VTYEEAEARDLEMQRELHEAYEESYTPTSR
jgi:hypothetical protein